MNRDEKQRPAPYKAIEFMNFLEQPPERKLTQAEIDFHIDRMLGV